MDRLNVLVLFGGMAEEHDISIKSAKQLMLALDGEKYAVTYVYITKDGMWRHVASPDADLTQGEPFALCPDRGTRHSPIDVAFPMLHGRYGEDGAIQGLFELAGIPYVGCGIGASAMCMDKSRTYMAAARAGVAVPRHWVLDAEDAPERLDLPYPLFVKPARSGSSFGVSKVYMPGALADAVRDARKYDRKVLIEEAIAGKEVGCALFGAGESIVTGEIDEIELRGGFFRIHQEKQPEQGSENAVVHVPTRISDEAKRRVEQAARAVYRALGCRGLARADMFLTDGDKVVLNEVNTMPGFTSYSRYPRMMAAAGYFMGAVVDRLIEMALEGRA